MQEDWLEEGRQEAWSLFNRAVRHGSTPGWQARPGQFWEEISQKEGKRPCPLDDGETERARDAG